jgi:hypothetical protein
MTLHFHKVDDKTTVYDGDEPRRVPAGWQIAAGSADDVRVCGAHGWQTVVLVFADGSACYTAVSAGGRGGRDAAAEPSCRNFNCASRLKIGQIISGPYLKQDAQGARVEDMVADALLRRRY